MKREGACWGYCGTVHHLPTVSRSLGCIRIPVAENTYNVDEVHRWDTVVHVEGAAWKPWISNSVINERPKMLDLSPSLFWVMSPSGETRPVSPQWLNTTDGSHLEGFQRGILAPRVMRFSSVHLLRPLMRIDGDFIFLLVQLALARRRVLRGFYKIFKKCENICGQSSVLFSCFSHLHFSICRTVLISSWCLHIY